MEVEQYKKFVNNCVRKIMLTIRVPGYTEEDLIHEGYLALIRAGQTFNVDRGVTFEAYAFRCIRNRIIDLLRKHFVQHEKPSDDLEDVVGGKLEEEVEKQEMVLQLEEVLKKCKADEQAIMGMYLQGYPYVEISKKLDASKKKIDNTIQKVKKLVAAHNNV